MIEQPEVIGGPVIEILGRLRHQRTELHDELGQRQI